MHSSVHYSLFSKLYIILYWYGLGSVVHVGCKGRILIKVTVIVFTFNVISVLEGQPRPTMKPYNVRRLNSTSKVPGKGEYQ